MKVEKVIGQTMSSIVVFENGDRISISANENFDGKPCSYKQLKACYEHGLRDEDIHAQEGGNCLVTLECLSGRHAEANKKILDRLINGENFTPQQAQAVRFGLDKNYKFCI